MRGETLIGARLLVSSGAEATAFQSPEVVGAAARFLPCSDDEDELDASMSPHDGRHGPLCQKRGKAQQRRWG